MLGICSTVVVHGAFNSLVVGSSPTSFIAIPFKNFADIAHSVEHSSSKSGAVGSSPTIRFFCYSYKTESGVIGSVLALGAIG